MNRRDNISTPNSPMSSFSSSPLYSPLPLPFFYNSTASIGFVYARPLSKVLMELTNKKNRMCR